MMNDEIKTTIKQLTVSVIKFFFYRCVISICRVLGCIKKITGRMVIIELFELSHNVIFTLIVDNS